MLDGRGGLDVASYADHTGAVHADLRAGRATAAGETDVLAAIEQLTGGSGDDVLTGDGAANKLDGGGGTDRLRGLDGDDDLRGSGTLDGGAGDDLVRLRGPGRAICGPGSRDIAAARGSGRVVDDSCERLTLLGTTLRLELGHGDPARDRVAIPTYTGLPKDTLRARLATTAARPRLLGSLRRPIGLARSNRATRMRFRRAVRHTCAATARRGPAARRVGQPALRRQREDPHAPPLTASTRARRGAAPRAARRVPPAGQPEVFWAAAAAAAAVGVTPVS